MVRRTAAKVKLFTELWDDPSRKSLVRFKQSINKWIGRDSNRRVGALQGAIGATWIGRDSNRMRVHCRVQYDRRVSDGTRTECGCIAGCNRIDVVQQQALAIYCLQILSRDFVKGSNLSVRRILSFETNSFTGLLYTFTAILHCVMSNLAYYT